MITWGVLLSELRAELQDTTANPRWSDALLVSYTRDAIRDYSQYFPLVVYRTELIKDEDGSYILPSDLMDVRNVECPLDTHLRERFTRPGAIYHAQTFPTYYMVFNNRMHLDAVTEDSVYLTYSAYHTMPTAAGDTSYPLSVPDGDIELIKLYVKAKVHGQMRERTSRLDRFDPGSGRRDDNPLRPEVTSLMDEYYTKISQRIPGGVIILSRRAR